MKGSCLYQGEALTITVYTGPLYCCLLLAFV